MGLMCGTHLKGYAPFHSLPTVRPVLRVPSSKKAHADVAELCDRCDTVLKLAQADRDLLVGQQALSQINGLAQAHAAVAQLAGKAYLVEARTPAAQTQLNAGGRRKGAGGGRGRRRWCG